MTRYLALDALRGLTIALMILVNTPGSWSHVYSPFLHASWHGWTPTDLVFPFFMFIVGSAMFFSFRKTDFTLTPSVGLNILRRGATIFLIGLFLNAYPFDQSWGDLRFLGVLQRIGIAYVIAAFLVLSFARTGIWVLSLATLVGYWLIMWLFGGSDPYALETNLVRQVDLAVLGASHLWAGKGVAFDPEGLLSTLPSVVSVLIGFEATRWITRFEDKFTAIKHLCVGGLVLMLVGYAWHTVMPINKYLWTSSFVLVTAAVAFWLLALFIWVIDIKNNQKAVKPLLVYGMNPLFIYVLSILWVATYPLISWTTSTGASTNLHHEIYQGLQVFLSPINASLAFAVLHVILFWVISWGLYKRNIIIKI